MAQYYFRNTGSVAYNLTSNWSLTDGGGATGAVPTTADDAFFSNNSGNCTINTGSLVCKSLDFTKGTGYTGTFTINNNFAVYGNITFNASMTIAGTLNLAVAAACIYTSNGKALLSNQFVIQSPCPSITYADACTFMTIIMNSICTATITSTVNTISYSQNGSTVVYNGGTLNISGSLTMPSVSLSGTTNIFLTGTGTWSAISSAGVINNNLTINTSGIITLGTIVSYGTGTLTYTAGTIVNTSSTLYGYGNSTINSSGMTWNIVQLIATNTITLTSDLNTVTLSVPISAGATTTVNGNNINVSGAVSCSGAGSMAGTSVIKFAGTTTFTPASVTFQSPITFQSGTCTISGSVLNYNTGTITYVAGTVNTGTAVLTINVSGATLNTAGITWFKLSFTGGTSTTITLNSLLTATSFDISLSGLPTTLVFAGTSGFTVGTILFSASVSRILSLKSGLTYTVTTALTSTTSTAAGHNSIICTTVGGTKAIFTLQQGATQDLSFVDGTDIDSSLGKTIWSYKGTLTRTTNWQLLPTQPKNISSVF